MSLITEILFPPRCIICDDRIRNMKSASPFCEGCSAKLMDSKYHSQGVGCGPSVTRYAVGETPNDSYGTVMYSVRYLPGDCDNLVNRFILNLKNRPSGRASSFAAGELYSILSNALGELGCQNTVITWIPRSGKAMKRYGFDHMALVAKELSKLTGIKVRQYLRRTPHSAEQKQLTSAQRLKNAQSTLKISSRVRLDGRRIVLIDDIITTGASLDTAAKLLLSAGAEKIIAVTLAKTSCS